MAPWGKGKKRRSSQVFLSQLKGFKFIKGDAGSRSLISEGKGDVLFAVPPKKKRKKAIPQLLLIKACHKKTQNFKILEKERKKQFFSYLKKEGREKTSAWHISR